MSMPNPYSEDEDVAYERQRQERDDDLVYALMVARKAPRDINKYLPVNDTSHSAKAT